MYKLVAVAGKLRGEEFVLSDGENILGRDTSSDIHVQVDGISKKHLSITVTDDAAFIKDLGSSNGTFVNGKLVKAVTIKNGDKVALPDLILQLVYVEEKKIIVKKKVSNEEEDEDEDYESGGSSPANLPGKIVHLFKYKIMKFLYGINEEYEWKVLFGILLAIFIFITVGTTITPVLESSKSLLLYELARRGDHYADEIARLNSRALEQKNLDQVDSAFLDNEPGVDSYVLFDLEGRIVRPIGRLNENINDPFSIKALEKAIADKSGAASIYKEMLSDGVIGISKKIIAYNARTGVNDPVGIIAIKFRPKSLAISAKANQASYMGAVATSALVAVFFFATMYFLTVRPIEEVKFQLEDSIRGKRKSIDAKYLMGELDSLRKLINSLLQRNRELQSDGEEEFEEEEDDGVYVDSLSEFLRGAGVPAIVLNSKKEVQKINVEAEDLTSIRESAAEGENIMDVCREQGFAATLIELCDNSASNNGTSQSEAYELTGKEYEIFVTSLIGKDNFAKAFYITFVKEE